MKVLNCYYKGIKEATLQYKMIFVLWLFYFIFGLIIFLLFFNLFSKTIGKSVLSENLLKTFDFNLILEFIGNNWESIQFIIYTGLILIIIFLFISIFLKGGILFTLTHHRKKSYFENKRESFTQIFFQGGGKFYGRFFRLLFYSILLWIVIMIIILIVNFVGKVITSNGVNEQVSFYFFWVKLFIGVFLFFLIKMILDYTQIKIVTEDTNLVFRSLLKTVKFVFQNLGKTLCLYYLLVFTGLIILILYIFLNSLIQASSLIGILIIFAIQQLFIISRAWLKIAFQASQLLFYSPEHFLNGKFPLI